MDEVRQHYCITASISGHDNAFPDGAKVTIIGGIPTNYDRYYCVGSNKRGKLISKYVGIEKLADTEIEKMSPSFYNFAIARLRSGDISVLCHSKIRADRLKYAILEAREA